MAYKRILVPVDGSPTSAAGLKAAIKMARESGAKLRLVHVVDEYAAFAGMDAGASIGPLIDSLKAAGKRTLERVGRGVAAKGMRAETCLVENFGGRIADAIVKESKRWKADVVVMGTHGRRGVKRVLLGSDADLVVRYSPIPVLLIPAPGRGR